jgi:hypothetical protein
MSGFDRKKFDFQMLLTGLFGSNMVSIVLLMVMSHFVFFRLGVLTAQRSFDCHSLSSHSCVEEPFLSI